MPAHADDRVIQALGDRRSRALGMAPVGTVDETEIALALEVTPATAVALRRRYMASGGDEILEGSIRDLGTIHVKGSEDDLMHGSLIVVGRSEAHLKGAAGHVDHIRESGTG